MIEEEDSTLHPMAQYAKDLLSSKRTSRTRRLHSMRYSEQQTILSMLMTFLTLRDSDRREPRGSYQKVRWFSGSVGMDQVWLFENYVG